MKRAYALVVLLVLTSVYGLADSIIPNVTPLPVISPSLSTAVAHPGTTFSLSINVGGVSNLSGFQFSFSFNPSVISATSMIAGSFLSGGTFAGGVIDNTAGTISLTTGTGGTATGSGTLAVIFFTALAPGASGLNLSNVALLDAAASRSTFQSRMDSINVTPGLCWSQRQSRLCC
jgi:hypothetical protein